MAGVQRPVVKELILAEHLSGFHIGALVTLFGVGGSHRTSSSCSRSKMGRGWSGEAAHWVEAAERAVHAGATPTWGWPDKSE